VLVEPAEQHVDLLFGEADVDHRQRDRVEGEVPGGEPRVLPLVRHGQHVVGDEVEPVGVADAGVSVHRVAAMLDQPALHVVRVVLLAPQHPGERLPDDPALLFGHLRMGQARVELVRLGLAPVDQLVELRRDGVRTEVGVGQPQPYGRAAAGRHVEDVVRGGLGPDPIGVHGAGLAADDEPADPVLDERGVGGPAVEPLGVGLVLGEQQRDVGVAVEPPGAEVRVLGRDAGPVGQRVEAGFGPVQPP
jgi:hypothetical protein